MPLPLPETFKETRFSQALLRPVWLFIKELYFRVKVPVRSIIQVTRGSEQAQKNKRLCLFVTYDPQSMIDYLVIHYVKSIKDAGFDVIVISTSKDLPEAEAKKLTPYCRQIIHRKNWGLDFGSWKTAMDWLGDELHEYQELLLANDSIFGPFTDFGEVQHRVERLDADICGLTENIEYGSHLQSFFVFFKTKAFHSAEFKDFWRRVRLIPDKFKLIQMYEIGMSKHFRESGFKLEALAPYETVKDVCLKDHREKHQFHSMVKFTKKNPTLYLWELLLKDLKVPFIKTDVLKRNPIASNTVANWVDFVPEEGRHLIQPIQERLDRIGQKAPDLQ